jgi:hypothetical protein
VRIEAWRERIGWAPPGRAFVTVLLEGWGVTKPCCTLAKVEVAPVWTLALPDGTVAEARPPVPGTTNAVTFEVPETVTAAEVRLSVAASFENRGVPGLAAGGPVAVPVELPT